MNLLRLQSVFALCVLFLIFGYDQVRSASPLNMTEEDQNPCASPCYESLKEQIQATAQDHIDRDSENRELRKRLLDLSDYKNHIKSLNDHIEELRKTNEILRESVQYKNNCDKNEDDLKVKAKDLSECMANQDKLKKEIEIKRKKKIEIDEKFKLEMKNLKNEKERIVNELETKSKKDSADHKVKEEILSNELKDLKSQVSSYKEQLKGSQNQLAENESLADISTLKTNQLIRNLTERMESINLIPKTGCKDLSSGIHTITIPNLDPFPALCNKDIAYGGWIVIQKRFNGSLDFYRTWAEYRKGFGKLDGEFFIGLENLHRITNSERYELFIDMKDVYGDVRHARYDHFIIGNENEKYELQSIGDFSGTAEDDLKLDVGAKFSTYDQDNDIYEDLNCAEDSHGAWWYNGYHVSNLNGRYYGKGPYGVGTIRWNSPLKSVQMLIRPKSKPEIHF